MPLPHLLGLTCSSTFHPAFLISLQRFSSLSRQTNGAGTTIGKHEPPQKGDPFKGVYLHSNVFLPELIFISTQWCCGKSPQDRGRMVVVILWPCFTWTGKSWGMYTALDFEQGSLRKCGVAQRAQCTKAVEMGPSLTPSLTLSALGDPQARNPSPPLPAAPPSPRNTEGLSEQFKNYRLGDFYSLILLFHPDL